MTIHGYQPDFRSYSVSMVYYSVSKATVTSCHISVSSDRLSMYWLTTLIRDLGWVDLYFECSAVCPILPGLGWEFGRRGWASGQGQVHEQMGRPVFSALCALIFSDCNKNNTVSSKLQDCEQDEPPEVDSPGDGGRGARPPPPPRRPRQRL